MKKMVLAFGGMFLAAFLMTGCAGVTSYQGAPGPVFLGSNLYTNVSGNTMVQPITSDFTVVKHNVTASAKMMSIFTCINMGDISYATLKKEALASAPGADDLVDVRMDYTMNNILGINEITVNLTGTAVKFK